MFSQAFSSLNRSSASMAPPIRSTQMLSALRSASAFEPEAAQNRSKPGWAAPSQLTPYPA
jgi:hypothetical protein